MIQLLESGHECGYNADAALIQARFWMKKNLKNYYSVKEMPIY